MSIKTKKLITHDGSFHTDDIFACATLALMLEKEGKHYEIIRTRDPEILKEGDYVFDVGGEYSPEKNIFDHHQVGGAGSRTLGDTDKKVSIEYASFGLVWKNFGMKLTEYQAVLDFLDRKLVAPIDAGDNGMNLVENMYDVSPYMMHNFFGAMHPTWKENREDGDKIFSKCVDIAKIILQREIVHAEHSIEAQNKVLEAYTAAQDKRIITLEKSYPYEYFLSTHKEPLFVIYPKEADKTWAVKAVREDLKGFKNKKNFPSVWAGLRDEELQKVTGVTDAVFCHRGLFLCVAKSKEGAIKLAQIALES